MVNIVKLVGVIIVIMGAIYLVKPLTMKKMLQFWTKEKHMVLGAAVNLLIGVLFFRAVRYCNWPWFVYCVGLVAFIKGGFILVFGKKKMSHFAATFTKKPIRELRIFAIATLAFGILLIFSA